jgi:phosphate/sulfate permease
MAIATTYAAKSGLPWWGTIVALIFAWLFVPIIGTVSAKLTNFNRRLYLTSNWAAQRHCWVCAEY